MLACVPRILLLGLALGLNVAACAYDLTGGNDPTGTVDGGDGGAPAVGGACIPSQAVFCNCSDGGPGVQTCGVDGTWGACDCNAPVGPPSGGEVDAGPATWEVTCETGLYWNDYEDEGEPEGGATMLPGGNCVGCHAQWREGPRLAVGGTVFLGLHDDDDCYGLSGVVVEITGADDQVHRLSTNQTGNFLARAEDLRIAVPYTARVVTDSGQRPMLAEQTDLDCNRCHTVAGQEGAPGRIVVPDAAVE